MHLADVLGVIRFLRVHSEIDGVVNVSSPNPSDHRTMMQTLRGSLGVPFDVPAPDRRLELGSAAIRSETELVLKSRWILPERLTEAAYELEYPELRPAVRQIVGSRE